jgi:histone-lysine N-methyltransferase MLL3
VRLASLTIIDFGKVREDADWHSQNNFFPDGWESLREYKSMRNPDERAFYWCTIFDVDGKPKFRVENEEEDFVVEKDRATTCWQTICTAINSNMAEPREEVTVSGPERFGITDKTVVMEELKRQPAARKCSKLAHLFK